MPAVKLTVNGKPVTADVDPRTLLVQFLRENLRLTGTGRGLTLALSKSEKSGRKRPDFALENPRGSGRARKQGPFSPIQGDSRCPPLS